MSVLGEIGHALGRSRDWLAQKERVVAMLHDIDRIARVIFTHPGRTCIHKLQSSRDLFSLLFTFFFFRFPPLRSSREYLHPVSQCDKTPSAPTLRWLFIQPFTQALLQARKDV